MERPAAVALWGVQPGGEHLIDSPPVQIDDFEAPAARFDLVAYLWNSADRLRPGQEKARLHSMK
jgi:hypothetical protein